MKFARRAEGIKSARLVFKCAREDKRSKYHVYVAAALMEYYCSKVRDGELCVCVCIYVHVCVCVCLDVYTCVCVCENNNNKGHS